MPWESSGKREHLRIGRQLLEAVMQSFRFKRTFPGLKRFRVLGSGGAAVSVPKENDLGSSVLGA